MSGTVVKQNVGFGTTISSSSSGRTHFSRAKLGKPFPEWLLTHRYRLDEWESKLIMEPSHNSGEKISSVDLRYWKGLPDILNKIKNADIDLHELDLSGNDEVNSKVIAQASRLFGKQLNSIILANCIHVDKIAIAFIGGLSNLRMLNVSDIPYIQDEHMERLVDKDLVHLHTLTVSGCQQLTDRTLNAVARTNNRFIGLFAARNINYTFEGVNNLLLRCENLEKLDLSFCPRVAHLGVIIHVGDPEHNILQFASRPISYLRLDECFDLSENSLDWICGALSDLEEIYLPRVNNLTDAAVQGLASGSPHLHTLHIQGCKGVMSEAISSLGANAAALTELNASSIGKVKSKSMTKLLVGCKSLTYLNISNNAEITDHTFSELELSDGTAIYLPKLKRLSVSNTSITAFGVACLAERCTSIEHLDISGHKFITDAALSVIAGCCRLLKSFWVNDCPAITDDGIIPVCYSCKRLEVLHLSSSISTTDAWGTRVKQFTDSVIEACLDGARCLRELTLRNQCGILFASPWLLTQLSRRGGHQFLEKIDLRGADSINLKSASVVFQQCSELCHVLLSTDETLPGVETEEFWNSAFSGCMYTEAYVRTPVGLHGRMEHFSQEEHSMQSLDSNTDTVRSTIKGKKFEPHVENGRYYDDTGNESLTSGVFSRMNRNNASVQNENIIPGSLDGGSSMVSFLGQDSAGGSISGTPSSRAGIHTSPIRKDGRCSPGSGKSAFSVSKRKGVGNTDPLSLESIIDGYKGKTSILISAVDDKVSIPAGYLALSGHKDRKAYRYRDFYIRRQLEEQSCSRFIQFKWKLFALWQRFRKRVSARRIANTYKVVIERRKMAILLHALAMDNSAKRIQRYFREKMLPLVNASVMIQKNWRGHHCKHLIFRMLHQEAAATLIQKIIRGVLVRISDRFILAQIYLKLPPFWRVIMNTVKETTAGEEATRKRIYPYQVKEARDDVQKITTHIMENVVTDGVLKPQMPLVVPQPFDKKPYLSVSDGRKISFYSHKEGVLWNDTANTTERAMAKKQKAIHRLRYDENGNDLFKTAERARKNGSTVENINLLSSLQKSAMGLDDQRVPMHQFNVTFWPHTVPMHVQDTSVEQHDPMINSFDLAQNYRETLYCEACRTRLRIVYCSTCVRGYCFFCAFRTHTEVTRRNHTMEMMEPRVVKIATPSKSLIYHVDMAQQASYDLKYLVKYMRSRAEVQRLQAEKRMAKEFEEQEEARRKQFLVAQGESNDKHQGATEIALLFRVHKSKRIVKERREQLALESVTKWESKQKICWIPFQKLLRQYLTRKWYSGYGVNYKLYRKRKKKRIIRKPGDPDIIPFAELKTLVAKELVRRRVCTRASLFDKVITQHSHLISMLDTNIDWWVAVDKKLPAEIISLEEQKDLVTQLHEEESQTTAALKSIVDPDEYEKLEQKLDGVYRRVEVAQQRLENLKNVQWWILQYLRAAYRRREAVKVRLADTIKRIEWVNRENAIVSRIEFQTSKRIDIMKQKLGMGMAVDWLQRYTEFILTHQATLDAQQESILLEESNRLARDDHVTNELDNLFEELYQGILADSHLAAERVYLDVLQLSDELVSGSEEALRTSEQLVELKRKQTQLNSSVIDTIKVGLQNKFNEEDTLNQVMFIFPSDDPEFTTDQLIAIDCQLLDPYHHPKHIKLEDFLQIYLVQPWLAEQAVGDVRLEESVKKIEIDKGKKIEERKGIMTTISDNEAKVVLLNKQIGELIDEIDVRSNIEDESEEGEFEKEERLELIATLSKEQFKKEGEVDVCQEVNAKVQEKIEPLQKEIDEIQIDVVQRRAHIKAREEERERLKTIFFESEADANHDLFHFVAEALDFVEKQIVGAKHEQLVFKASLANDSFMQKIQSGSLGIKEREALGLPVGSRHLEFTNCLKAVKKRTTPSGEEFIRTLASTRLQFNLANVDFLEHFKNVLDEEEIYMNSFHDKIPRFEEAVKLFSENLLAQRRQKAMQIELELRKKRLNELRETRMRSMKEAAEKLDAEAKQIQLANKKSKANVVPFATRLAKATKAAIRGTKDFIRDLRNSAATAMDQEEIRMARKIKGSSAATETGRVEGIRKLFITKGPDESYAFEAQQKILEEKGIPYYERMERSFGNQFYIWTQNTYDNRQMITHIEFFSNIEGEELYHSDEEMRKDKWEPYGHHDLRMTVWVKRDPTKLRALKDFEISLSMAEENRNLIDGFEKLEQCMDAFGLPDSFIWVKKVDKLSHGGGTNTDEIINEVLKVRELLKSNPNDRNMQALMGRLEDKLKAAYEREKKNIVTNPLRAAVELLSLTPEELEAWMQIFEQVDVTKEGSVSYDEIFEYFEETPSFYAKEIFVQMDALDEYGRVEFGDFIRAIGTYCFFGKQEILRFMFVFADKDKKGHISHAEFVTLLNSLNPFDKQRAKRALQELQMVEDKEMDFEEFARMNDEFPNAMYPAFRLQDAFRTRILGDDWWWDKLAKYKGVRKKLMASGNNVDEMAAEEMKRFEDDVAKERRMKERDVQIRNETSAIRKTLLQARQMVDEFS